MESRNISLLLAANQIEQFLNFFTPQRILLGIESIHNSCNHDCIIKMMIVSWLGLFILKDLRFRLFFAICIHQPNPSGEQFLHHALLDLLVLCQFLFQLCDFVIHARENLGNGLLLLYQCGVFQDQHRDICLTDRRHLNSRDKRQHLIVKALCVHVITEEFRCKGNLRATQHCVLSG